MQWIVLCYSEWYIFFLPTWLHEYSSFCLLITQRVQILWTIHVKVPCAWVKRIVFPFWGSRSWWKRSSSACGWDKEYINCTELVLLTISTDVGGLPFSLLNLRQRASLWVYPLVCRLCSLNVLVNSHDDGCTVSPEDRCMCNVFMNSALEPLALISSGRLGPVTSRSSLSSVGGRRVVREVCD
jgi:hypothetical protein